MYRTGILPTLLVASLLLPGCSLIEEDQESWQRRVIDVGAISAEVLRTSQQSVFFAFKGGLPVPCYEFKEAVVNRHGRTVAVRVRARSTAEICITVTGRLRVSPLAIDVPGPGKYRFEFWRGPEAAPLTVKVDVPQLP